MNNNKVYSSTYRWTLPNQSHHNTTHRQSEWSALDPYTSHPLDDDTQNATEKARTTQVSSEFIHIKDSADIEVNTTDTQAAISLQAALQAAIALVISISIADSSTSEKLTQELLQKSKITQVNKQATIIENSRNVRVTTTDTDLAVHIQILLQILVALLVKLDIL